MKLTIAGGGTGGHLFPGIALAEELVLRNQGHEVLFVGTQRGIEARAVPKAGFALETIEVGGLKGKGPLGWLKGLFRVPRAMWQSRRILKKFRPDVVVGVGGYASGPAVLMAWLMGIKTMVLEQNALPGFTNKILGKFVKHVIIAFAETEKYFPRKKILMLGNPVRKSLVDNFLRSKEPREGLQLLVFGGSQGARALNEVVPKAVSLLREKVEGLRVQHQTGQKEQESVAQKYAELGLKERVEVLPFIEDMAAAYRQSDLVVCRAGATTVAELALCRKASVLIPFPFAADNHQEVNASALVNTGAAVMLRESDLNAERLAKEAVEILTNDELRIAMEDSAGEVSRPASARDICEVCLDLASGSKGREKETN